MSEFRYRLIAIDLDGTFLSPLGKVTDRAKAAVHQALQAGMLVVFATGRNWTESKTVLDAVQHYDTAVFVGGAMVVDTRSGMTLHRTLMDPGLARQLCGFLEQSGHPALALQDTSAAGGTDYLISAGRKLDKSMTTWVQVTAAKVEFVKDLSTRSHEHTVRVGVVAPVAEANKVRHAVDVRFGDRVYQHQIHVPAYGVNVLEIFDPSTNKWQGILHVANARGIKPEEIIAIGDDVNDLHMLRNAGLGVAMGNAIPEAKKAAKKVIGTNAEEGLAQFIEELVEKQIVQPENAPRS
jgi:Cof subfamily protein (haloacid dehalogenase superfamily)